MSDFTYMIDNHPLIGGWVYIDSGGAYASITHISNDFGKLSLTVVPYDVDDNWKKFIKGDEKLSTKLLKWDKNSIKYVSWYKSVGRKNYRVLEKVYNNNKISIFSHEYSDKSALNKIGPTDKKNPLIGIWRPEDDDHWSQYEIKKDNNKISIIAMDYVDKIYYTVKKIKYKNNKIQFKAKCPISGRVGFYKFRFLPDKNKTIMYYKFREFGYLKRIYGPNFESEVDSRFPVNAFAPPEKFKKLNL